MALNGLEVKLAALAHLLVWMALAHSGEAYAAERISVAVLGFDATQVKGMDSDLGEMLSTLLSARLSSMDGIVLVDRTSLDQAVEEQALGLSGIVDAQTAALVGKLVGAQVLITGRAFTLSRRLIVTARLIGTEAGNLYAVAEEGSIGGEITDLVSGLVEKIDRVLSEHGEEFVAVTPLKEAPDLMGEIRQALSGLTLPRVAVQVEETLFGVKARDSVAATELTSILLAMNLPVIRAEAGHIPGTLQDYLSHSRASAEPLGADVIIFGKAAGQFGLRTGDLVSAKGKVTFTAVDTSNKRVLAVSEARQKGIDVVAEGAGIQAITAATRESARDFVPKVVRAWNRKH